MINISLQGNRKQGNELVDITISISEPYWVKVNEEAACKVVILPFYKSISPISGINHLQAIKLACNFVEDLLNGISEKYILSYKDKKT